MARFVFVTGGVVSSLGKGITAAAIGALLQAHGYSVRLRKADPYLNLDPGTMSPNQHGEVFVTDDGTEADLDLGHYERFTGMPLSRADSVTSGRIYAEVLRKERRGDYQGRTVQVVPHVTDEIAAFIREGADDVDFIIIEIGGTIGDIEALPHLEAVRQVRNKLPRNATALVHLSLLPYLSAAGELKTKPTQHSVKELLSLGLTADIILVRSERPASREALDKIAEYCNVRPGAVVQGLDLPSIYDVPAAYHEAGLDRELLEVFGLPYAEPDMARWAPAEVREDVDAPVIGVITKYQAQDSYLSLHEAIVHGGAANGVAPKIRWIDAEMIEAGDAEVLLGGLDGIIVPGGFGARGTEGKIAAITYARTSNIPFLGICLGMQMSVVETSRNVAGLDGANSTEFFPAGPHPVVGMMTEWASVDGVERRNAGADIGGTLRLGAYPAKLSPGSLAAAVYGAEEISERHRHRYEVNMAYSDRLEAAGMRISGKSPDGLLPEIVERPDHPWFLAVQFHPELKSRPFAPHPLFTGLVSATLAKKSRELALKAA